VSKKQKYVYEVEIRTWQKVIDGSLWWAGNCFVALSVIVGMLVFVITDSRIITGMCSGLTLYVGLWLILQSLGEELHTKRVRVDSVRKVAK